MRGRSGDGSRNSRSGSRPGGRATPSSLRRIRLSASPSFSMILAAGSAGHGWCAPSLRPEQGRSYFLGRLVREVIFGEAMLASERPGAARRRVLLRGGAFAAAGAAVLIVGALLWHARSENEQQIDELAAALSGYEQTPRDLPREPIADTDMPRILPGLDQVRALPHGYD